MLSEWREESPTEHAKARSTDNSLMEQDPTAAVVCEHVSMAFDEQVVLRDISFSVARGRMTILLGASGSGKSVLLKLILGLMCPDSGAITVDGHRIDRMRENLNSTDPGRHRHALPGERALRLVDRRRERRLPVVGGERGIGREVRRRVEEVLGFVGLGEYIERAVRALRGTAPPSRDRPRHGGEAELLLLDDPTVGLDPITAATIDDQIVKLRDLEAVTSIVVTHTIRDAFYVASHRAVRTGDRVEITDMGAATDEGAVFMMLHDGRIAFEGSGSELLACTDPHIRRFLAMTLPPW